MVCYGLCLVCRQKIMAMHLEIERLNEALEKRAKVGLADPPAVSVQDGSKKSSFTFKKYTSSSP